MSSLHIHIRILGRTITMKTTLVLLAVVGYATAQYANQPPIPILRQASDISPDGSFQYSYETGNGIQADAQGSPAKVQSQDPSLGPPIAHQGRFAYTADDGTPISVQYIADENGFQPQGAHLPTPPPIPPEIQRALEFIARNPQPQYQQQ